MYIETGEYELHIPTREDEDKRIYYTFIPKPLCNVNIDLNDEIYNLLIIVYKRLSMLEGMCKYAPNIDKIKNYMIKKELCYSLQIDGDDISFREIILNNGDKNKNTKAENYFMTTQCFINKKLNSMNINGAHGMLMGDSLNNSGEFRHIQTFLSRVIHDNTSKRYNPTAPQHISTAINNMVQYINSDDKLDYLIKVALVHYQFEIIHPFEIGNGKLGRLIMQWMINNKLILTEPVLCISEFLFENKEKYFNYFFRVERFGEYVEWVKFILEAIIISAEKSIKTIDIIEMMIYEHKAIVKSLETSIKSISVVYDHFLLNPISNIKNISDDLGISFNTASKAVNKLVEVDIIFQWNNQTRHRQFGYKELIMVFEYE